ncbi:MAG: hypothetical protein JO050_01325 [Acidimicrobiia bacterium]|nr:hypothetical protein [Acidimicrobiia bacterium]
MGGGLRVGQVPTRLLAAGWVAAVALAVLATAALAAQGAQGPGLPAAAPPLARVAGPHTLPAGATTPLSQPTATTLKPRSRVERAAPRPSMATTTVLPPPPVIAAGPEIPDGKGMWIWQPEFASGGNAAAVVAVAQAVGLTHLFVRTGSTWDGLQNMEYLDQLLPLAQAANLKVYGWDFPKLASPADDVFRAKAALDHVAPGGFHLDGFAADIETSDEGTQFTPAAAQAYGAALRAAVGPSTLLIAVVPNPTPQMLEKYSYDAVVGAFDAVAPMVYWLNRDPGQDTANALHYLSRYGKPLMPIGQAYDGGLDGGPPGVPSPAALLRFVAVAKQYGAVAVSFWSWQHANPPAWDAIKTAPQFIVQPRPRPPSKR